MTSPASESICGGCGTLYTGASFRTLDAVETLGEVDIRRHVVAWPEGRAVEVRACRCCGHPMARLGPRAQTAAVAAE
jgi:hypothetical protein